MPTKNLDLKKSPMTQWFRDHEAELVGIRHYLHMHPELSFKEQQTGDYIEKLCRKWNYKVTRNFGKTGLVCSLRNGSSSKVIGIRAEMDALPILEKNTVAYRSCVPNVAHMCGHDGHMTMALAAAYYLAQTKNFNGTVNFYFQPAEEISTSGAQAMVQDGVFKKYPCDLLLALHGLPTTASDNYAFQEGHFYYLASPKAIIAAGDTYYLEITGHGGHSSYPDKTRDPIVAACALVMDLQTIVARNVPPTELGIVSVGMIHGGEQPIVIPYTVKLAISTRAANDTIRSIINDRIYAIIKGIETMYVMQISVKHEGFPATVCDPEVTQWVRNLTAQTFGTDAVGEALFQTAGEDIPYFFEHVRGCYGFIGNGITPTGVHENQYNFNDHNIIRGGIYYATLVENYLGTNSTLQLSSKPAVKLSKPSKPKPIAKRVK